MKTSLLDQWTDKLGSEEQAKELLEAIGDAEGYTPQLFEAWYYSPGTMPDEKEDGVRQYFKDFYGDMITDEYLSLLGKKESLSLVPVDFIERFICENFDLFSAIRAKGKIYIFRTFLTADEQIEALHKERDVGY